jgi:ribokinase
VPAAPVVVVASINVDLVVHAERLPGAGETVAGGTLHRAGGGKGANQAVAAARAGAAVRLVGAVGADDFGAAALEELRGEGVDVGAVLRLPDAATGVALIVVDRAGDNQIAVASGANHALTGADVAEALAGLAGERGCVLTGFEVGEDAVAAAAAAAGRAGWPLIVDPAPARPPAPELLAHHPILTPNHHEAAALTGHDDPEAAARALVALTGAPAVVTLGAGGALVADRDGITLHPAPRVAAVDTTGAGDVFAGVLAGAVAAGRGLRDAVEVANAAAAEAVTRRGAR